MVGYLDKLPPWCQDDLRPVHHVILESALTH